MLIQQIAPVAESEFAPVFVALERMFPPSLVGFPDFMTAKQ